MAESPLPTHCIPSYASFVHEVFSPSPILRIFILFLSPSGVHSVPPPHAALSPPAARSYVSIGAYSLSLKGLLVLNYCYFSIKFVTSQQLSVYFLLIFVYFANAHWRISSYPFVTKSKPYAFPVYSICSTRSALLITAGYILLRSVHPVYAISASLILIIIDMFGRKPRLIQKNYYGENI